ncbi:hypothetical protein [Streptomyces mirabilis]|uniref:hypothetical protein n=1 Tax=Streptomyces mirabilis TaxID=68239 RepID=UPI003683CFB3
MTDSDITRRRLLALGGAGAGAALGLEINSCSSSPSNTSKPPNPASPVSPDSSSAPYASTETGGAPSPR